MAIERNRQWTFCCKYFSGNVTFVGAILELKGSIQYIRKWTFIEIIFLIKFLNISTFVLKDLILLKY